MTIHDPKVAIFECSAQSARCNSTPLTSRRASTPAPFPARGREVEGIIAPGPRVQRDAICCLANNISRFRGFFGVVCGSAGLGPEMWVTPAKCGSLGVYALLCCSIMHLIRFLRLRHLLQRLKRISKRCLLRTNFERLEEKNSGIVNITIQK